MKRGRRNKKKIKGIEKAFQKFVANLLDRNIFILNLFGDLYWYFYKLKI